MYTLVYPSFTIWNWGLSGSKLYRHVFLMQMQIPVFEMQISLFLNQIHISAFQVQISAFHYRYHYLWLKKIPLFTLTRIFTCTVPLVTICWEAHFPPLQTTKKLIKDAQDFKPLCLYSQIHRSFKRSTKKRERECVKYILGIYHGYEG